MLCTDVDGLFTGNPKDQASEFIPTYSPEVRRAPQQSAAPRLQHHVHRSCTKPAAIAQSSLGEAAAELSAVTQPTKLT